MVEQYHLGKSGCRTSDHVAFSEHEGRTEPLLLILWTDLAGRRQHLPSLLPLLQQGCLSILDRMQGF